ncbi:MAG TPA: hypothetical protein VJ997_11480, partial [Longimicrobiales bacterium]|nr:hypothetical protein [Longimicrobiales bacterium]
MTGVTGADRTPTLTAVFVEQVRAVGLAVRREAVAAGVLMCLPWLGAAVLTRAGLTVVDGRPFEPIPLDPGDGTVALAALAAVVFAWLVWRGEAPFGDAAPWSLPVDHRRHMLTRVAAGWVWLMVFVGAVWLWIVVMTAASGRAPGVDRMQV